MTTTAKDIITAAYARRTANDPDKLATKQELIGVLSRRVLEVYARAARVNPEYFSRIDPITPASARWTLPADAVGSALWVWGGGAAGGGGDRVLTGTDPEADRVHVVPFRDQSAEMSPKVYRVGRAYYTPAGAADPSASDDGDVLNMLVAFRHAGLDPTLAWDASENTLASHWPEHHNDLLVLPLARYLAVKDGRGEGEIRALDEEYTDQRALFLEEVELTAQGESARWGQAPRSPGKAATSG